MKKSKLIRSSFWYTIGNFFIKGISFVTIPIFVNITSQAEYGLINNFTSFVSIFSLVVGLSLNSCVNNASFDYRDEIKEFLSSVLFLATSSFLIFVFLGNIMFLFRNSIFDMNPLVFNLMLSQSFSTFLVAYVQAYFTIHFEHFKYLALSLISTTLNVGISVLLMQTLLQSNKYLGRALGGALGLGIIAVILYMIIMFKGKKLIDISYWKYALKISLPLIPHTLSNVMLAQFGRIMINSSLGASQAGIYSYISNIGIILNVVWQSTNNAWVPWFYGEMNKKKYTNIKKVSNYYLLAFTVLSIVVMVGSVDLARIMAPEEYYSGLSLVIPISLGYFFQFLYSLPVNVEFYEKKTTYIALGTVASAIVNIGLNIVFIPKLGIIAAGYTTVVTYFLLFLFHYFMAKKITNRQLFNTSKIWFIIVFMIIFSVVLHLVINHLILRYTLLLVCLVVIGGYFIKNKKRILQEFNS
ncbi:lipopolysaccharide biosynthesis protein [Enterococcus faecium]|uniref:lipopolysaccharide biosynthesis protein n=1 Tax=Enterococcus faecium TaxID=1352 RepID=UPI00032DE86D|nr:oligosaccharide flippase family protein [Enterococcus faecium]EOF54311.1 polysaccharide biosynthesis protein [Enterococcus faecium EnGen0131]MDV7755922.1 oligosaccharide flippase family protein [Enterococcus faecium]